MDVVVFGGYMLAGAQAAIPYLVGGLMAALLIFVVFWGIREAMRLVRDLAADREQRRFNDAMGAHYEAEYDANYGDQ